MNLISQYFEGYKSLAFDNLGYWGFILVLAAIFICLLLANLLIKVIKPLGRALIPSPVLGGFILLLVLTVYKLITGNQLFNTGILEMITYHCLGLGFVATSLKKKDKNAENSKKKNGRAIFQCSMITVSGYLVQAILGLIISLGLFVFIKSVWPASGALLPMGYGQGPGQALSWGTTYSNYRNGTESDVVGYVLKTVNGDQTIFTAFLQSEDYFTFRMPTNSVIELSGGYQVISENLADAISNASQSGDLYYVITFSGTGYCFNTYSSLGQFVDGNFFGLAIAAMGFVSASVGGIFFLAINRKRGNPKFKGHTDETVEEETLDKYTSARDIPCTGTIDRLSVNVGLVILGYVISFGVIYLISLACDKSGIAFLVNTIKPLFWGFNFIVGTGIGVLLKLVIVKFENKGTIKHNYINNFMMDRISGLLFDVMVVAAIGSIDLSAFKTPEFILPLIVMCVVGGIATYFYVKAVCKNIFTEDGYYEESFLAMYGMLTGTASTGVILLREIDPQFKTPACKNLVLQALWAVILGAPVLLLMSFVGSSIAKALIGLGFLILYFIALNLILFKNKIFKKKLK